MCLNISGNPISFSNPPIAPPISYVYNLQTVTRLVATGVGVTLPNPVIQRTIQNLGLIDITFDGQLFPPGSSWTEKAQIDPVTNSYKILPGNIAYDATGSFMVLIEMGL